MTKTERSFEEKITVNDPTPGSDGVSHLGFKVWKAGTDKDGYGKFRKGRAHRFALEKKLGRKIRAGFFALHTCDYPACVDARHLWEGTADDNLKDCKRKGRTFKGEAWQAAHDVDQQCRGENNGRAKLTAAIVRACRRRFEKDPKKDSQSALAREFGITSAVMSKAIRGEIWGNV